MIKIACVTVISVIIVLYLKSIGSEYAQVAGIGIGVLIISLGLSYFSDVIEFIKTIADFSGIENSFITIIFKITIIGYIVEFASGIIEDAGMQGVAKKLIFVGKIIILSISLPVLYAIFNLITGLLQ